MDKAEINRIAESNYINMEVRTEAGLLAAILHDNSQYFVAEKHIGAEDFGDAVYSRIFKGMGELLRKDKPANAATLTNYFGDDDETTTIKVGDKKHNLFKVISAHAFCGSDVRPFVQDLQSQLARRRILDGMRHVIDSSNDYTLSADEIYKRADEAFYKLTADKRVESAGDVEFMPTMVPTVLAQMQELNGKGLETGFKGLGNLIGKLQGGDYCVVGARTGVGKTAFCLSLIDDWTLANKGVLMFSLEMPKRQVLRRFAAIQNQEANRPPGWRYNSEELSRIEATMSDLQGRILGVGDSSCMNMQRLVRTIRRVQRSKKVDVVIIDYLGLLEPNPALQSRYHQITEISRQIKQAALELDLPFVVISQLNREAADKEPSVSHMRDSGAVEQDADQILLLHRVEKGEMPDRSDYPSDKVYQTAVHKWDKIEEGTKLIVAKSRHWKTGVVNLRWTGTRYLEAVE